MFLFWGLVFQELCHNNLTSFSLLRRVCVRIALIPLDNGRPIELGREMTLVGRSQEADLKLDHKSVSKLHCVLVRLGDGLLVRDLGSTNGTRINGQRVRRGALVTDDVLNLAHYTFRIEIGEPSPKKNGRRLDDNATLMSDIEDSEPVSSNGSAHQPKSPPQEAYQNRSKGKRDSSVRLPALPPPPPPGSQPPVRGPLPDTYDD